jgi:hypothetical protein
MGFSRITNSRHSRHDPATAIKERRDTAADILGRTATKVRRGSKTASKLISHGGSGVADRLDVAADRVGATHHHGPYGYLRGHPLRLILFATVLVAIVGLLAARRNMAGYDDDLMDD